MIPKNSKFPMRTGFVAFRSRAKRFVTPHLIIYSGPGTNPRCAVVVPVKVSKLAVTRNYLKRLTYDTVWPLIKEKNLDFVVVYKPLPLSRSVQTQKLIISELKSLNV